MLRTVRFYCIVIFTEVLVDIIFHCGKFDTQATTKIPYSTTKSKQWKPRISYQAASSVLETSTRLVMTAWQLHMTTPWFRLLRNRPYLCPRVLSASQRILYNAKSRPLREQLRWSGDTLYSAGAGDARWMVYPGGEYSASLRTASQTARGSNAPPARYFSASLASLSSGA
jgi:hypothetical protein